MSTAIKPRSFGQLRRQGIARLREEWAEVDEDTLEAGIDWYDQANSWVAALAKKHGKTVPQVAGIAAVLSPRLPWHRAIMLTERLLDGEDISSLALGRQARKANEIMAGLDPYMVVSGPKVTSFFHNLMGEYDWVTIDTWSFNQASGRDYNDGGAHFLERNGVYEMYSTCFRAVARDAGLEPAVMQAILWIHARGKV
jgi:hypothetical protein